MYLGLLQYFYKKIKCIARYFESTSQPIQNTVCFKNISIDKNNLLYSSVLSTCEKNKIDTDKKVLICCTGNEQSMALLTIAMSIFGSNNVSVLTINHHKSKNINNFILDICEKNNLNVHLFDCDTDIDQKVCRYERIISLTKLHNIHAVFEAHTLENYSNSILNDIFSDTIFTTENIITSNVYKPFNNIKNEDINDFINEYNIPIDQYLTHYNYSLVEPKNIFSEFDDLYESIYPNWRNNLIKYFQNTDKILNQYKMNIDKIIEKKCYKGKHGFVFHHDLFSMPYATYKTIVDLLADEYNFDRIDFDTLNNFYINSHEITMLVSEEHNDKLDELKNYLNEHTVQIFKNNSNNSNNSNDSNDSDESISSTNSFEPINNDNHSDSDDNIYYMVDLFDNEDEWKFTKVNKISYNYRDQFMDGIIYIMIDGENFYICGEYN
jgi:hypothetical protein